MGVGGGGEGGGGVVGGGDRGGGGCECGLYGHPSGLLGVANMARNKNTCTLVQARGGPARALWSRRRSRCHGRGFTRTRTHAAACESPRLALSPTGSPGSSKRPPMHADR